MDASEKIRIAKNGLNDGMIEILKLMQFPQYKDMDLKDEYIVYDSTNDNFLIFTHRDSYDNILDTYSVNMEIYNNIPQVHIPCGDWQIIDRDWAKKKLEDKK